MSRVSSAGGALIPRSLDAREKRTPNHISRAPSEALITQRYNRPSSRASSRASQAPSPYQQKSAFRTNEERSEIHDLVRETVKEYFGTLSSREMAPVTDRPSSAMAGRMDQSQARRDREAWVVVKRPPEWANSRPASSRRSATPNATWNNPQNMEFKENLDSYMSSASDHEQEIVRNLLKKLNNGKTPKELLHKSLDGTVVGGSATARPPAARDQRIIPAQYQCDVSHFQPLPLVPNRHFIISPEWTSERYMVKKVPAAHLHPTATLKNKLGLLNS